MCTAANKLISKRITQNALHSSGWQCARQAQRSTEGTAAAVAAGAGKRSFNWRLGWSGPAHLHQCAPQDQQLAWNPTKHYRARHIWRCLAARLVGVRHPADGVTRGRERAGRRCSFPVEHSPPHAAACQLASLSDCFHAGWSIHGAGRSLQCINHVVSTSYHRLASSAQQLSISHAAPLCSTAVPPIATTLMPHPPPRPASGAPAASAAGAPPR